MFVLSIELLTCKPSKNYFISIVFQTGLKKKKQRVICKTEYRLSKKKRKLSRPDPEACLQCTNGVDEDRGVHAPSHAKSLNKKEKKLGTETTNEVLGPLERTIHVRLSTP